MRKRLLAGFLCAVVLAALAACGGKAPEKGASHTIRPVELSQDQQDLLQMLGGIDSFSCFDYTVGDEIKGFSIWLERYEEDEKLTDEGADIYGVIKDGSGKISAYLDNRGQWVISLNGSSIHTFPALESPPETLSWSYFSLPEEMEIVPGDKIVLVAVAYHNGVARELDLQEYLNKPVPFSEYERVELITLRFA